MSDVGAFTFEASITLGNLIEISSILGGGLLVLLRLNNSVVQLAHDMRDVQEEIKKIGELMRQVAVQSARLDAISDRMNMMDRRIEAKG
jgi:hypothetical protein